MRTRTLLAVDVQRWRVITSTEQKKKFKAEEQLVSHAREYVAKVEDELQKIRDGILALMDKELIPSPHDKLRIVTGRTKFEQRKTDSILYGCESHSRRA